MKKAIFIFLILLCSIYQDFPLVRVFGEIARTPIVFLSLPMLVYMLCLKKLYISKYSQYLIYYYIYLLVISVVYLASLTIYNETVTFLNENIFIKAVKMAVYPVICIIYYQFIYTWLMVGTGKFHALFRALLWLEIFIFVYLVFEIAYNGDGVFLQFVHSLPDRYWRIRLITYEESWVGPIITILVFVPVFLANYLNKSGRLKLFVYCLSAALFLLYTLKSESKGYLLLILISVLPLMIKKLYENERTRKLLLIALPVILIAGILVFISLFDMVSENIYSSGTFGTRFGSYAASLNIFIYHPFGVGFGSFVQYLSDSINEVIFSPLMASFDISEIKGYQFTTQALSTKTYFFDSIIFGGIGFFIFFYLFYIKRYMFFSKRKNTLFIIIPLLFIVMAGIIYVTYDIKYEVWFFLAFIDVLQRRMLLDEKNEIEQIEQ